MKKLRSNIVFITIFVFLNLYPNSFANISSNFIDDITESLIKISKRTAELDSNFDTNNPDPSNSWAPYKVFNIANSKPTNLNKYIEAIEKNLNKKAEIIFEDMQPGDVEKTFANTETLERGLRFKPSTSIDEGIKNFIRWYLSYYKKKL